MQALKEALKETPAARAPLYRETDVPRAWLDRVSQRDFVATYYAGLAAADPLYTAEPRQIGELVDAVTAKLPDNQAPLEHHVSVKLGAPLPPPVVSPPPPKWCDPTMGGCP